MRSNGKIRGFVVQRFIISLLMLCVLFPLGGCSLDKYTLVEPGLEQQIVFTPNDSSYESTTYPSISISILYSGTVDDEIQIRYNITSGTTIPSDPPKPTWDSGSLYLTGNPIVCSSPPLYYKIYAIAYKIVGGNARYSQAKLYSFYHGTDVPDGGLDTASGTVFNYTGGNVELKNPDVSYTYKYTISSNGTPPVDPNDEGTNATELGHAETLSLPNGSPVIIKLRSYRTGFLPSSITSYTYHRKCTSPQFNPGDGTILGTGAGSYPITLQNRLTGATYYYNSLVNATPPDPTTSSTVLSGNEISITDSTTVVKIFCTLPGYVNSDIVTLNYKLRVPAPVVAAPSTGGVWFGHTKSISVTYEPGSAVYYTSSPSGTPADPIETDATYSASISLDRSRNYKFRAFKTGWEPSTVVPANYNVKHVYTAVYSVGKLYIYRDNQSIHTYSTSAISTVEDVHVKNGKIFVCGSTGTNAYLYIYHGSGSESFNGNLDHGDIAKAVYVSGGYVYVLVNNTSAKKSWVKKCRADSANVIGENQVKCGIYETSIIGHDLVYVDDSHLYVSGLFKNAGEFLPVIIDNHTTGSLYITLSSTNSSNYAGKMVYDGTNLHVIGKGVYSGSPQTAYWKVRCSDFTLNTANYQGGLIDLYDISRDETTGVIRILAYNGSGYPVYDENFTQHGTVSGTTPNGIRVVNGSTWAVGGQGGGVDVLYTYDSGSSPYGSYPLSAGYHAMDVSGDYIN